MRTLHRVHPCAACEGNKACAPSHNDVIQTDFGLTGGPTVFEVSVLREFGEQLRLPLWRQAGGRRVLPHVHDVIIEINLMVITEFNIEQMRLHQPEARL